MRNDDLLALVLLFAPLSLVSIGGGASVIAGIQHEVVVVHGWLSAEEFLNIFTLSRASPGPAAAMLATLIGWRVEGWIGAVVATLAFFLPSSLLCYAVFRLSNLHRDRIWHKAMREGLAPVGVGLTLAGAISIFRLAEGGMAGAAIVAIATAILILAPRFPALGVLLFGGVLGYFLLV